MERTARVFRKGPKRTPEALNALWKACRRGDLAARNALLEEYLFIVDHAAVRQKGKVPHSVQVEDLRAAGFFGLLDAVQKFDPARNIKFTTFCAKRVHGAMIDSLRDMDHVPRLTRGRANKIERAHLNLEQKLARIPVDRDLAKELGITLDELDQRMDETRHAFSTPMRRRSMEKDPLLLAPELMHDRRSPAPAEAAASLDMMRAAESVLARRQWWLLMMHYLDGFTLREAALAFGMSESRACQLDARAIELLQRRYRAFA